MSSFGEEERGLAATTRAPAGTGPRGGTTTVTRRGWVKKNLWMPAELAEQLREKAFKHRTSEAEIVRSGLEQVLPLLGVVVAVVHVTG